MNKKTKKVLEKLSHGKFSYWNTRIIKHKIIDHFGEEETVNYCYGVHEVYYDKKDQPVGWTENPIRLSFESLEDLWGVLEHIVGATSHTVFELTTTLKYEGERLCSEDGGLVDTGKTLIEMEKEAHEKGVNNEQR